MMDRNEAIARLEVESRKLEETARTEVDDEEVRSAISDLHDAADILNDCDEMDYEDGLRKAADLITRLYTQIREQANKLELAERQRDEAMATLLSLFVTASPAVREVCRVSIARIGAMSTTTCEHSKELTDYCEPCGRIHGSN